MAQGKAIVATTVGAEGTEGEDGQPFPAGAMIRNRSPTRSSSCCATPPAGASSAATARARVVERYSWPMLGRATRRPLRARDRSCDMNPLLKRLYDLAPAPVQNALLTAFSARLEKAALRRRVSRVRETARGEPVVGPRAHGRVAGRTPARGRDATPTSTCLTTASCSTGTASTRNDFAGAKTCRSIPLLTRETIKSRIDDLQVARGPRTARSPKATRAARPARRCRSSTAAT